MIKVTVIGAGKTGRGFLGRLLQDKNVSSIDFIDKDENLVKELNEKKSFTVHYFGNDLDPVEISNYHAYTWEDAPELQDIVFVSVGALNLQNVGEKLKDRLHPGMKIIVSENAINPSGKLKAAMGREDIPVAESTVFCTTVSDQRLDILSETYPYLQYDADAIGILEGLSHFKPEHGFKNFLTRKIFTYNAASAIIAYLGALKGYTVYSEAANDPYVLSLLDENYRATNKAMCEVYGYDKEDQEEFALLSKKKFTNPVIQDSIERNARDPIRKLGPEERIVGPLKLLWEKGYDTLPLTKTLAAALLYRSPKEEKFNQMVKENGYAYVLKNISKIDPDSKLGKEVLSFVGDPKKIFA